MEERTRFVLEALEGWSSMSELCRRCGISRRIGYKWLNRYKEEGLHGLADRSKAPRRQAQGTAPEVVNAIIELRKKHPTCGPRKLRARLDKAKPGAIWPACSTIRTMLKREGLSKSRRRRPWISGIWSPDRTEAEVPNRVWTADFKGEFCLGCGRLCYPLTVFDAHSRYVLDWRGFPGTRTSL